MRTSRRRKPVVVAPTLEPMEAPGVAYFHAAGAESLKFFRCEPHAATLSMGGCGARWRAAQVATGDVQEGTHACRTCPIGAAHAGSPHVTCSRLYGAALCPRCRFGATRIIGGRICVNCYNREREMISGRNSRGNVPTKLLATRPLHAVEFAISVDGHVEYRRVSGVVDQTEAMLQILRTTTGRLTFGFSAPAPVVRQRSLLPPIWVGSRMAPRRRLGGHRSAAYASAAVQGEFWPVEALGRRPGLRERAS